MIVTAPDESPEIAAAVLIAAAPRLVNVSDRNTAIAFGYVCDSQSRTLVYSGKTTNDDFAVRSPVYDQMSALSDVIPPCPILDDNPSVTVTPSVCRRLQRPELCDES